MANLYEILGVDEAATADEIKSAYRRQAMMWHPDRNPERRTEAEERFKEIGYAYKALFDPQQRAQYDASLVAERSSTSNQQSSTTSGPSMSEADAEDLFFDQMLDLALELANRGFNEATIYKTLLGLDCPDAVSKAVAKSAVRMAQQKSEHNSAAPAQSNLSALGDIETATWEAAEPYYSAVIGGKYATQRISDDELKATATWRKKLLVDAILWSSVGAMIVGTAMSFVSSISIWQIGMVVFPLVGVSFLLTYLYPHFAIRGRSWYKEIEHRAQLAAFQRHHMGGAKTKHKIRWSLMLLGGFAPAWFAYRRMPLHALIGTLIMSAIYSIATLMDFPEKSYATLSVGLGGGVAASANFYYYRDALARIRNVASIPSDQALASLRKNGGVNSWSWLAYVVIFLAIIGSASVLKDDMNEQRASVAAASQRQVEEQSRHAAAVQKAEFDRRMSAVIAQIEASNPELNEKSGSFNQRAVDFVLDGQKRLITSGLPPDVALQQAYQAYIAARQAAR